MAYCSFSQLYSWRP